MVTYDGYLRILWQKAMGKKVINQIKNNKQKERKEKKV
jgi:hypothetical protein